MASLPEGTFMNTNTTDKPHPLCEKCGIWRDYRDNMIDHPDYDGHCWYRGIMTKNVLECYAFMGVTDEEESTDRN